MTPEEVVKFAKENGVKMVDFKFTDLPGSWQHFSVPVHESKESLFSEGVPFDGSSIRGFQAINNSDMTIIPDASTAILDPFTAAPTLSLICDIAHPGPAGTQKRYSRDPRYIAQKAEAYLRSTGIADTAYFGPEAEFFIFDQVSYASTDNKQYAEVDSEEGPWNSGRATYHSGARNLGHLNRVKEGYFPVAPNDTLQDLRTEMALLLESLGVEVEAQHHEVGAAGQAEIDIRFNTLVKTADSMLLYKYIVKNTARKHGKTVTFMPKPVYGDNGSGMHTHQSLWKDGKPLFFDEKGYAGLSELALYYVGGLLTHAASLLALTSPTTNSYKRLVPGFEAPVNIAFSARNRSAAIRIPMYSNNPKAKRLEFRPPDPSANPYLALAAVLSAGVAGVEENLAPPAPITQDPGTWKKKERAAAGVVALRRDGGPVTGASARAAGRPGGGRRRYVIGIRGGRPVDAGPHELLERRAGVPRVRLAAERTVAVRGKTDRRRAVVVLRLRDLIRERAFAAARAGRLDQRVGGGFHFVDRMGAHPLLRALPPGRALIGGRAGERRGRDPHHVRIDLAARRAAGREHAQDSQQGSFHCEMTPESGAITRPFFCCFDTGLDHVPTTPLLAISMPARARRAAGLRR